MSKLIALRSGFSDGYFNAWRSNFSSQIKQQVLLFDQIGFLYLDQMLKTLSSFKSHPDSSKNTLEPIILELRWLEENGIIFEAKVQEELQEESVIAFLETSSSQKISEFKNLFDKVLKTQIKEVKSIEDVPETVASLQERDVITLRLISIIMEATNKVTAVTTLPPNDYLREIPNSQKNDVFQIAINKLPLPNNETPWEQLIDYRVDPENQKNLLNLRRWIKKISAENISPIEIEEEIEWLISEFQNHMKVHKMKANTETLEVMIKAPLEIIENLIKLKLSKIPEPLFALKKRQINLMEAELNAPGREMAYIIKAKDTFQSSG